MQIEASLVPALRPGCSCATCVICDLVEERWITDHFVGWLVRWCGGLPWWREAKAWGACAVVVVEVGTCQSVDRRLESQSL
jgi:hypothetical protein